MNKRQLKKLKKLSQQTDRAKNSGNTVDFMWYGAMTVNAITVTVPKTISKEELWKLQAEYQKQHLNNMTHNGVFDYQGDIARLCWFKYENGCNCRRCTRKVINNRRQK